MKPGWADQFGRELASTYKGPKRRGQKPVVFECLFAPSTKERVDASHRGARKSARTKQMGQALDRALGAIDED